MSDCLKWIRQEQMMRTSKSAATRAKKRFHEATDCLLYIDAQRHSLSHALSSIFA